MAVDVVFLNGLTVEMSLVVIVFIVSWRDEVGREGLHLTMVRLMAVFKLPHSVETRCGTHDGDIGRIEWDGALIGSI